MGGDRPLARLGLDESCTLSGMAEPLSYVPCSSWATDADWCCPDPASVINNCAPGATPAPPIYDHVALLDMSSEMLYAASGYMFPGICTMTVEYPKQCPTGNDAFSPMYPGFNQGFYTFDTVRQNNGWPCCRSCDPCRCLPSATTHYPITEVVSIEEDGVALDLVTAQVSVASYNHIRRCDGKNWQACKTVVTLKYGRTPPLQGKIAAAKLACAIGDACNPDPCHSDLVTGFVAAGRTYNLLDIRTALANGTIPIPEVQLFLGLYGGASRKPVIGRVWTPDLARRSPKIISWVAT